MKKKELKKELKAAYKEIGAMSEVLLLFAKSTKGLALGSKKDAKLVTKVMQDVFMSHGINVEVIEPKLKPSIEVAEEDKQDAYDVKRHKEEIEVLHAEIANLTKKFQSSEKNARYLRDKYNNLLYSSKEQIGKYVTKVQKLNNTLNSKDVYIAELSKECITQVSENRSLRNRDLFQKVDSIMNNTNAQPQF